MIIDNEQLSNELKNAPGEAVLAIDDLQGGRIPVENVRFERRIKPEKPGMASETLLLIFSDKPRLGEPALMKVKQLKNALKTLPTDAHAVFDKGNGEMIPIESIRRELPVQFEKPGTHTKTALVILSENPWN